VTEAWITIAVLAVATVAIRASGPVALGGRDLPDRLIGVIGLVAPALLAALVVTQTFTDTGDPNDLILDERAAGVAAAGGAMAWRGSVLLALAAAVGVTAGLRAL
jgi:branched-subunit amino acid transport protein